jgi:hypothetical protein
MEKVVNNLSYRYERKSFVSNFSIEEIEGLIKLHPFMFSKIYYPRFVNSIYLDTFNMSNFLENMDGLSERVKVRIRWYNDLFGIVTNPVLEIKIKRALLGTKKIYKLKSFKFDKNFSIESIRDIIKESNIQNDIKKDLEKMNGAVIIRYKRKYFQSVNKKFRITLDKNIEYRSIQKFNNRFLEKKTDYNNIIFELKYDEKNDELAKHVFSEFPFRMTRNSKYISGIENFIM